LIGIDIPSPYSIKILSISSQAKLAEQILSGGTRMRAASAYIVSGQQERAILLIERT
jgi:hypothetical protein